MSKDVADKIGTVAGAILLVALMVCGAGLLGKKVLERIAEELD